MRKIAPVITGLLVLLCAFMLYYHWLHAADRWICTIDKPTLDAIAGAGNVETFRLADFEDHILPDPSAKPSLLDNYTITSQGSIQDNAFARRLSKGLSDTGLLSVHGTVTPNFVASCFDPGVGYRIRTKSVTIVIAICFHCSGVEIIQYNDKGKEMARHIGPLDPARAELLAISKSAFPNDAVLGALK